MCLTNLQLAAMRERDPSAKALIFTQFNATLQWLMERLSAEGYGYRTISGSMPMKKRSQVRRPIWKKQRSSFS